MDQREVPIDEFDRATNEEEDAAAAALPEVPPSDELPADEEVDEGTRGA